MSNQKNTQGNLKLLAVWNAKKDALNLTQASAAHVFDFESQSAISEYINGKIPLNLGAAYKFAHLLNVTVGEIWDGDFQLPANISPESFKEKMALSSNQQRMEYLRIIVDTLSAEA